MLVSSCVQLRQSLLSYCVFVPTLLESRKASDNSGGLSSQAIITFLFFRWGAHSSLCQVSFKTLKSRSLFSEFVRKSFRFSGLCFFPWMRCAGQWPSFCLSFCLVDIFLYMSVLKIISVFLGSLFRMFWQIRLIVSATEII